MIDAKKFQIRKVDSAGRLAEAGFNFSEARSQTSLLGCVYLPTLIMLFSCGFSALLFQKVALAWVSFLVLIAGIVWGVRETRLNRRDDARLWNWRSIVFSSDGRILVTSRTHPRPLVAVPVAWADVVTIEPRPARGSDGKQRTIEHGLDTSKAMWEVNFHLSDGQTVLFARDLVSENYAHFVSTQLNLALDEMRAQAAFGG
jgi:hypothetical protein